MSRRNSRTTAATKSDSDRSQPIGSQVALPTEQLVEAINQSLDARFLKVESVLTELAHGLIALSEAPAFAHLHHELNAADSHADHDSLQFGDSDTHRHDHCYDEALVTELRSQIEAEFRSELECLEERIGTLQEQNTELAGQLAQASIRKSLNLTAESDPTLTWEQRKAIMFASDVAEPIASEGSDPQLVEQITKLQTELQVRSEEVQQLQALLEQRPQQVEEGTAVGAAAFAMMMDSDELIREERQRLQELQAEWEAKFREVEIAASIERANLARQRMQLEKQNAELEEQLTHLKRELRQEEQAGPNHKRRWLAKLGLAE